MSATVSDKPAPQKLPPRTACHTRAPGPSPLGLDQRSDTTSSQDDSAVRALEQILDEGILSFQADRRWPARRTLALILLSCGAFWLGTAAILLIN